MKITRIMQSPALRVWDKEAGAYVVKTPSVPMEVTIVIDEHRLFTKMGNRAWANSGKKSAEAGGIIMSYAKPIANARAITADNCAYCDANKADPMMPRHEASQRCESGKHPHCTCDVCF